MNNDIRNQIGEQFLDKYIFKNFFVYDGFAVQVNNNKWSDNPLYHHVYTFITIPISEQIENNLADMLNAYTVTTLLIEDSNNHR